jgi:hypothetical protein
MMELMMMIGSAICPASKPAVFGLTIIFFNTKIYFVGTNNSTPKPVHFQEI